VPRVILTDQLPSSGAAKQAVLPRVEHRQYRDPNNRGAFPTADAPPAAVTTCPPAPRNRADRRQVALTRRRLMKAVGAAGVSRHVSAVYRELRGGDPVMPQEILQGPGGDAAWSAAHRKGLPQHVRGHRLGDAVAVRHTLHNPLDLAGGDAKGALHRVMMLDQQSHTVGHGQDTALRALARRTTLRTGCAQAGG
jgi:hypothetical protein